MRRLALLYGGGGYAGRLVALSSFAQAGESFDAVLRATLDGPGSSWPTTAPPAA